MDKMMPLLRPARIEGKHMHFVVANINSTDSIKLFFCPNTRNDSHEPSQNVASEKNWRLLPGIGKSDNGVWESPAWHCGHFNFDILIRVLRSDGQRFDILTSEIAAFGNAVESSAFQLIEVPVLSSTRC